jgi:hypothetical protein
MGVHPCFRPCFAVKILVFSAATTSDGTGNPKSKCKGSVSNTVGFEPSQSGSPPSARRFPVKSASSRYGWPPQLLSPSLTWVPPLPFPEPQSGPVGSMSAMFDAAGCGIVAGVIGGGAALGGGGIEGCGGIAPNWSSGPAVEFKKS